jgi:hypothetical protein
MSMALSSDNTPIYTPASSTTGSVLNDPPKTVLATFCYRFTTFLSSGTQARLFTLNEHPVDWPNTLRVNNNDWRGGIRESINAMATQYTGAAQLLLVILWSYILKDESHKDVINSSFWAFARRYAVNTLFQFQNAPDQYLGWIKGVNPRNKGHLRDIVSKNGQTFFTVDSQGHLTWLSNSEGHKLAKNTIGELPPSALKFV